MTITLPDELRPKVEERAKNLGFATPEEYLLDLVMTDDFFVEAPTASPLQVKSREHFERLLDEAVASGPPIIVDEAFWEERRRVLSERLAARAGRTP